MIDYISGFFLGVFFTTLFGGLIAYSVDTSFEKCSDRYSVSDEVVECMWLLENN